VLGDACRTRGDVLWCRVPAWWFEDSGIFVTGQAALAGRLTERQRRQRSGVEAENCAEWRAGGRFGRGVDAAVGAGDGGEVGSGRSGTQLVSPTPTRLLGVAMRIAISKRSVVMVICTLAALGAILYVCDRLARRRMIEGVLRDYQSCDEAVGAALYKEVCSACHPVTAPDLRSIAIKASTSDVWLKYLIESIVDPDAVVVKDPKNRFLLNMPRLPLTAAEVGGVVKHLVGVVAK
jgi:hypothetical protein